MRIKQVLNVHNMATQCTLLASHVTKVAGVLHACVFGQPIQTVYGSKSKQQPTHVYFTCQITNSEHLHSLLFTLTGICTVTKCRLSVGGG